MMPVVRISDATIKKLQPLAIPLTDSIDSLLNRLADAAQEGVPYVLPSLNAPVTLHRQSTPTPWDVEAHDDLTHTRLISADFDGVMLPKVKGNTLAWNTLAKYAHEMAFQKLGSFELLRLATRAHVKEGKYEEEGFVYLPSIDVSLQGMDANMSWDNGVRLAHAINVPVSVVFEWRTNPKAAKPGQKSQLMFMPK